MQLSQEYERWFRSEGQFLPPADTFNNEPEKLEMLKQWGAHAHEAHEDALSEKDEEVESAKSEVVEAEDSVKELKEEIVDLCKTIEPEEAIKEIQKLCE